MLPYNQKLTKSCDVFPILRIKFGAEVLCEHWDFEASHRIGRIITKEPVVMKNGFKKAE